MNRQSLAFIVGAGLAYIAGRLMDAPALDVFISAYVGGVSFSILAGLLIED